MAEVVRGRMDRRTAAAHVETSTSGHIEESERAGFREVAETELLGLHEGNFARYAIRPGEFAAWQDVWNPRVSWRLAILMAMAAAQQRPS